MNTYKLGNVLAKVKRPGKLKATEYQLRGAFPVIDQGAGQIAGFTDLADIVLVEPLPIVVFGDHTRRVKLAREPFVCGADGTQLLYPNTPDLDPHFFYYAVKNIDLSNYFYARHFKFLKDQEFQAPDLEMQKRLAAILSAYDDSIENNWRRIVLLKEAARQLYKEWFVRLRFPGHEHTKITDGVPEGWEQGKVADLGQAITGKTPSKKVSENFGPGMAFIKTPDMHGNALIISTEESLSERGANSQANKTLPIGSILVSCIGTIGVVAMNAITAQTNQQINAIVPNHKHWQFFSYFTLEAIKPFLEAMGGGATMANVNKSKFENVPIVIADDRLISHFDETVRPLFTQVEVLAKQNQQLAKARDLLLPRLMNGSLTV